MFLSQEIEIKLCQYYTKSYIHEILYKIRSIKQIHIQHIRNQYENDYIPQEPENLRFAPFGRSFGDVICNIYDLV